MSEEIAQAIKQSELLSYQPILDSRQHIIGVEMVSHKQEKSESGEHAPHSAQSVSAILNAFIYAGMDELFRHRKVFIKVAEEFLLNEVVVSLLPKERVVLELSPCDHVSPELLNAFKKVSQTGYVLALDAWKPDDQRKPLVPYATYVKVRMENADMARTAVKQLSGSRPHLLASRVNDEERLELAHALGAEFFQGRFYQVPKQISRNAPSVQMQTVLDLIVELNSDGPDSRLEEFFKENPHLNLQLLHMVNSAATGFSISINSIKQAIAVLGRSQMIRWLQIMLYSLDDSATCPSPLMQSALWRARFMEILAMHYQHKLGSKLMDLAFITGVLSLADALLGIPMEEVLARLKLSSTIAAALLHHEGPIGQMLELAKCLEAGEFELADKYVHELNLKTDFVLSSQNNALAWANKIGHPQPAES